MLKCRHAFQYCQVNRDHGKLSGLKNSGNTVFKISRNNNAEFSSSWNDEDHGVFSQLCVSEKWTGNLSNGIIELGSFSSSIHGLDGNACGLLSLMRCYEPSDRPGILSLFEQASMVASRFCFTTTVRTGSNERQPVFCTGESCGQEERFYGVITGMFMFPRFQVPLGQNAFYSTRFTQ